MHGPELKLQLQDCRGCHGQDLTGGVGPSCDTCHTPADPQAWRTTCTFCHGGTDNQTGAPPRNLAGTSGPGGFPAHTVHVTQGIAAAQDCTSCHVKPADALSMNHVFDATPGAAEVVFTAGPSPAGTFDGTQCSNLYCHGNGRGDNGTVALNAAAMTCASCHPSLQSGSGTWSTMSGDHRLHLSKGMTCTECHNSVTADNASILDPLLHVDGQKEVVFTAANFTYDPATRRCNGSCHGEGHNNRTW